MRRRVFTLLDWLVTLEVIAIVIVLLFAVTQAVQEAREAAGRMECKNSLKQFWLAFRNYHESHSVAKSSNAAQKKATLIRKSQNN